MSEKNKDLEEISFRNYVAEPTIWKWLNSKKSRTLCVGPIGSGKSSGFAIKCFMIAARVMKDPVDGIRKSVIVIARNTEKQLLTGTIPTFKKWFPDDGKTIKYHKTDGKIEINMNTSNGRIQSTWWFISLDKAVDQRKLLSLEATAFGFDEFREINEVIFQKASGRVGRFPAKRLNKEGKVIYGCFDDNGNKISEVFAVSNCPTEGSFYGRLLLNPDKETEVFWQPGGKDPGAENLRNLEDLYYDNYIELNKNNQDLINVDVHAKLGRDKGGLPVYQSFIPDIHVSKEIFKPDPSQPVIVGMDFALNPSAVFMQQMFNGQLRVIHELVGVNMHLEMFLSNFYIPLVKREYMGCKITIFGDPSGVNRKDTDGSTVFKILENKGFNATTAKTNNIITRISSVEQLFTQTNSDGTPKILFNKNLQWLISGCRGGYKFKKRADNDMNGMIEEKPEKGMYSHAQDALQYACLYWNNPAESVQKQRKKYEPFEGEIETWGGF